MFFLKFFKKPKTKEEINHEKELTMLNKIVENLPSDIDKNFLIKLIDSEIEIVRENERRFSEKYCRKSSLSSTLLGYPTLKECIQNEFNRSIQRLYKLQILISLK